MIKKEFEAYTDQIWRDKDKRSSSGNRHVRLGCVRSKNGKPAFQAFRCYLDGGKWMQSPVMPTLISLETLRTRFELVHDPESSGETQ